MAQERSKVLPVGFYWVDVFGEKRAGFSKWTRDMSALVKLRKTTLHDDVDPVREWHLFEVIHPVLWLPQEQYGFPEKATATTEEGDTVQRPDPERDPLDQLGDKVNAASLVDALKTFSWVGALALGLWGLSKLKK